MSAAIELKFIKSSPETYIKGIKLSRLSETSSSIIKNWDKMQGFQDLKKYQGYSQMWGRLKFVVDHFSQVEKEGLDYPDILLDENTERNFLKIVTKVVKEDFPKLEQLSQKLQSKNIEDLTELFIN